MKFLFFIFLFLYSFLTTALFGQTIYDAHLKAAKASGVPPLKSATHISTLLQKKKLVSVKSGRGYNIAKLEYSRPVLNPKAYRILKQIGVDFYIKSKRKILTVTSITRTLDDQRRLSKVNSNAVTDKLSSHNYGCSFDISYIRFNRRKTPNAILERVLQNILLEYEKRGKILLIKEYREMCFHITVR